ncbi:hypothetical protein EW145_g798 [Phellinidium pouzarii]|uniref:Uncharacterized protein n=1 Tax=Phellinidium pouzarii TaxID=167371 RepID=A0A4S4LHK9_9AGAM|nr:hypothetical protein EW145_g798 [Phellinidium pouzarii]
MAQLLPAKVVCITGASRGIGRATALEVAKQGATGLILHYFGDEETTEEIHSLKRDLERFYPVCKVIAIPGDIAKRETSLQIVEEGAAEFARIAVANQMKEQIPQGGAIVTVSSISALVGGGYQCHYTPTKAALLSLMQSCAIALGKYNIRCNAVLPGTIATDINKEDLADQAKRDYTIKRTVLGRLGAPEDVAGPITFLASDLARYVTGASLLVDGGLFVNLQ